MQLTEAEWFEAIQFLTATGQKCDDIRQEFILLSDTMGVSMVVDLISHRKPAGATESTVFGPFHRPGAPEMAQGTTRGPRAEGHAGHRARARARPRREPIGDAVIDVWQADSDGFYDSQLPNHDELQMRGLFRTGPGRALQGSDPAGAYPIPTDGPVGAMLRGTNRHPWRPGTPAFRRVGRATSRSRRTSSTRSIRT